MIIIILISIITGVLSSWPIGAVVFCTLLAARESTKPPKHTPQSRNTSHYNSFYR